MIIDPTAKSQEAMTAKTLVVPPVERSADPTPVVESGKAMNVTISLGGGEGEEYQEIYVPSDGKTQTFTSYLAVTIENGDALDDLEAGEKVIGVVNLRFLDVTRTYSDLFCVIEKSALENTYSLHGFKSYDARNGFACAATILKSSDAYTCTSCTVANMVRPTQKSVVGNIASTAASNFSLTEYTSCDFTEMYCTFDETEANSTAEGFPGWIYIASDGETEDDLPILATGTFRTLKTPYTSFTGNNKFVMFEGTGIQSDFGDISDPTGENLSVVNIFDVLGVIDLVADPEYSRVFLRLGIDTGVTPGE